MTTHEIEEMLGITKQSLIYYEKEGLIRPRRNENNYRDYGQDDIDILKIILLLRSMEVSIDDIKLILNGDLSIRDTLESKKEYIEQSIKKLEVISKKIKEHTKRRKVKISFNDKEIDQWKGYDTLYFNKDHIKYNETKIKLSDIKEVGISMYSSIGMKGYSLYFVDIDIICHRDIYSYSIKNNDYVLKMFDYLTDNQIHMNDPLHLNKLYHEKRDPVVLHTFINSHFRKWAKEYHLDNPRSDYLYEDGLGIKSNYCSKIPEKK